MIDLDNLTLDDIADMPEYKVFPSGAYLATISLAATKHDETDKTTAKMTLTCKQVVELTEEGGEEIKEGDMTSISFALDNEYGLGFFKKLLATLMAGSNIAKSTPMTEAMEKLEGTEVMVVLNSRKVKSKVAGEEDRVYQGYKEIRVM